MEKKKLIITIDGPAASGKGTVAKKIAEHFNLDYLDSGVLYRLIAYYTLKNNIDPENISEVVKLAGKINLNDKIENNLLRTNEVSKTASKVAAHKELREALVNLQRDSAAYSANGIVADGRDMGTIIFPNASYKFFLTASVEERANRRFKELQKVNKDVIYTQVMQELVDRDNRDASRLAAPLKPASDAIIIDTTTMDIEEVVKLIINKIA